MKLNGLTLTYLFILQKAENYPYRGHKKKSEKLKFVIIFQSQTVCKYS